ncbi:blocked early in transport 1 [Kwoniella heveanensis BCC8398]|uniref:Blocked early in transport 1 n=1 Tax=Kwoniella heveanensis BCC8398 TaxID=1296120 RepID=A0A1B9GHQ2_9TREE|nr:blocked early in transport 1 [Kwoniella heveanensis BCC8398]
MPRNTHPSSSSSHAPSPVLYPPSGPGPSGVGYSHSGPGAGFAGPGAGTSSLLSSGRPSPSPSLYNRPNSAASQYSESPFGGGMSSGGMGGMGMRDTSVVEGQNDERLEGLLGKVKILKDITVGIGNEVRDSNIQLGNMNDTFSSTSNFLGGTFRRMNKMASKQGGNWCWFMGFLLLVLWIFVVVWWLRR